MDRIDVVYPNQQFWKVLAAHSKRDRDELHNEFIFRTFIAFDPGETTGVAIWRAGEIRLLQIETPEIGQAYKDLDAQVEHYQPDHIRAEEYRVYGHMTDQHAWNVLHTPQLIGAIKVISSLRSIPISFKLAQMAKSVWNDNVLKMCATYSPGLKHARDACRHLLLYMSHPERTD